VFTMAVGLVMVLALKWCLPSFLICSVLTTYAGLVLCCCPNVAEFKVLQGGGVCFCWVIWGPSMYYLVNGASYFLANSRLSF